MNCGAQVAGRFCQVCGQENVETRETFWHLVTHFFNDITHYDGKFFSTIKLLLLKPGLLTAEYVRGRRHAYLHPIRMYVFTSAFFFLLYFTFFSTGKAKTDVKEELVTVEQEYNRLQAMETIAPDSATTQAIKAAIQQKADRLAILKDSVAKSDARIKSVKDETLLVFDSLVDGVAVPGINTASQVMDSSRKSKTSYDFMDFDFYQDVATYLAVQEALPPSKKDDGFEKALKVEVLKFHEKQKQEGGKMVDKVQDKFKHSFPTILFISLPVFAWLLKLLYTRRNVYYASHGIFAIHAYCGIFLLLLLYYSADALGKKTGWWIFSWIELFFGAYILYFVYKAMRNFYEQGRMKTLLKYIFLGVVTSVMMLALTIIFLIVAAYRV